MKARAPVLARVLLRLLLRGRDCEFVRGDIEEEFETHKLQELGEAAARRWYWRQALASTAAAWRPRHLLGSSTSRGNRIPGALDVTGDSAVARARPAAALLSVVADLKYAARSYARAPRFTLAVLATFSIGIGANAVVLPFPYGMLLRPLPFSEPDRLAVLFETAPGFTRTSVSYPNFVDWRDRSRSFTDMAAYSGTSRTLTGGGTPERLDGYRISHRLFSVLGVSPALGRDFIRDDEEPGGPRTVVLSHELWRSRFGGDPAIVGRSVTLEDESHLVIGVMPPGFGFPARARFWVPLTMRPTASRTSTFLSVVGRLAPDATLETARAEMAAIADQLEVEYPETNRDRRIAVRGLADDLTRSRRTAVIAFYAAVSLVLVLACANVAILLVARTSDRARELAMRQALGASRLRIGRQLLSETALLSLVGGAAGLFLGAWGRELFVASVPEPFPDYFQVGMGFEVLLILLGVTVASGALAGLLPAVSASGGSPLESLRRSGPGGSGLSRGVRLQSFLVAGQLAVAVVVLIGTVLMMRSLQRIMAVDPGFNTERLLTVKVSLPRQHYPEAAQQLEFFREAVRRIESLPGVLRVSGVSNLPMTGSHQRTSITVEGFQQTDDATREYVLNRQVLPNYFEVMGVPLLRGADFAAEYADPAATQVVAVEESLARRYWPNESALGKRIKYGGSDSDFPWMEVVGVVANTRQFNLDGPVEAGMYRPLCQAPIREQTLLIKTRSDPLAVVAQVRQEIWAVDSDLPLDDVWPMDQVVRDSYWEASTQSGVLGAASLLALLLAASGVYGVITYSVAQRTREIGVRLALGAKGVGILSLVMKRVLVLTAIGTVCGVTIALLAMRLVSGLLFQVGTADPSSYGVAAAVMLMCALLAAYLPGRRAAALDPLEALRAE